MSPGRRSNLDQPLHGLELVLLQPQIAPNVGNIGRLCVATGVPLHLVRPLGFVLSDRQLRRAGLDYWQRLRLSVHDDTVAFLRSSTGRRRWYFDSTGTIGLWQACFAAGDMLCFGAETSGIDPALLGAEPNRVLRIPQVAGERCLNLSTSCGIALYEAIRQLSG